MFLVLTHTASYQHEFGCLLCLSVDVMCDVTLPLTPLSYVTRRHNNVNSLLPSERDIIYGRPFTFYSFALVCS